MINAEVNSSEAGYCEEIDPIQNKKMQTTEDQRAIHFRKRAYQDIPWDTVFEGSIVKCDKCLNMIRSSVFRENADKAFKLSKKMAPRFAFVKEASKWSRIIGIKAKELANDPLWCCDHRSTDETFL